jgi:hypothetical protein
VVGAQDPPAALIPLDVFRDRNFSLCNAQVAIVWFAETAMMLPLTKLRACGLRATADAAGLADRADDGCQCCARARWAARWTTDTIRGPYCVGFSGSCFSRCRPLREKLGKNIPKLMANASQHAYSTVSNNIPYLMFRAYRGDGVHYVVSGRST